MLGTGFVFFPASGSICLYHIRRRRIRWVRKQDHLPIPRSEEEEVMIESKPHQLRVDD